jgi:hypothetical protein
LSGNHASTGCFARIGARFERACTLDLMGDPEGRAELADLGVPPEAGPA